MSIALPSVSLASVSVGQTGIVDLKNTGVDANPSRIGTPAHLMIYNESGVGLIISFLVGQASFHLPAGGWLPVVLQPGESQVKWAVEYVLNVVGGAPVSQLLVTYYAPNEPMPPVPQLGNSPIGGSVGTSSIQSLSNEGNPANQLVIDIGDAALAQLWQIFTDHFSISVDQSGTSHTVLQGKTSGNPLLIGKSGDISEVLGNLTVDGTGTVTGALTPSGGIAGAVTFSGDVTANGAGTGLAVTNNETVGGTLGVTGSITANASPGVKTNSIADNIAGGTQITLSNASPQVTVNNDEKVIGSLNVSSDITTGGKLIPNSPSTTVNGSVAGSITFVTPIWGSGLKVMIAQLNGWNSASVGTFIFPSALAWGFAINDVGGGVAMTWGLNIGATAQSVRHMTGLGASNAVGTDNPETAIHSINIDHYALTGGGADRIVVGTTGGVAITGVIILIGN